MERANHVGSKRTSDVGAWYLESNRFGHYLVFDTSDENVHRLVTAVEECGLGVVRWDASTRPSDDGVLYEWFIRLAFDGSRDECLKVVNELLTEDGDGGFRMGDHRALTTRSGGGLNAVQEAAEALVAAGNGEVTPDRAMSVVGAFLCEDGYLAWRFRTLGNRPGTAAEESPEGRLQLMASIVRDDGEMLARLRTAHGDFLLNRPHLARKAIEAEFDKIDPDDGWWSSDAALRRVRASLTFLRHAVVLSFGNDSLSGRLQRMFAELEPPTAEHRHLRSASHDVVAAVEKLRGVLAAVRELLGEGSVVDEAVVLERGRSELTALGEGAYTVLSTVLPEPRSAARGAFVDDLPFVVLPPGEQLWSFVDELRRTGNYLDREVDLERLRVLTRLGELLDAQGDRYEIRRGAFSSTSGRDNGYVVLSIARHGDSKTDAVAISPWKGEHATYLVRNDCYAQLPWHEVLSKTKREARDLGARRLLFQSKPSHRIDVYEAMLQKIVAWLECDHQEFELGETYFDYRRRRYCVRMPEDTEAQPNHKVRPDAQRQKSPPPSLVQQVARWIGRRF